MTEWTSESSSAEEPVPLPYAELRPIPPLPRGTRLVGSVRVPLTLHAQPKATVYRFPDGRTLWCLRLWESDRPVRRCVSTATLRRFARIQCVPELTAAIDRLIDSLREGDDPR